MKKIRINHNRSLVKLAKDKIVKDEVKQMDFEEKIANLEQILQRTQALIAQDEHDEKLDKLLNLMYSDDVDVDFVKTTMNISDDELSSFVKELVDMGFLEFVTNDEIELTKAGVSYVKNQESDFLI